jgi:hypothetical protein
LYLCHPLLKNRKVLTVILSRNALLVLLSERPGQEKKKKIFLKKVWLFKEKAITFALPLNDERGKSERINFE